MAVQYVSAWDPGGTTGFCIGHVDHATTSGFRVIDSGVVMWHNRFSRIRSLLDRYRPHTTVVESFTLYRHKAQDQIGSTFPSAQVIGIIEAYCFMTGVAMPIYQKAAQISGKPPVLVLPEHKPLLHDSEHARDAYKHLRYWMVQHLQHTPVPPRRNT